MTRLRAVVLLVFAALLLAACGESRTVQDAAPATAATIEGLGDQPREIPRSELEEVVASLEGSDRFVEIVFGGSPPPTLRQEILGLFIQVEAIESLVAEEGAEVTPEDRQQITDLLRQQLTEALTQAGAPDEVDTVLGEIDPYVQLVTEHNALRTALGRKLTEGQAPGSQDVVCARHILVTEEARANELLAELQGGADFAALASANSTDTGSGANGGDLQCAAPANYVTEFAEAVQTAPLNEVVGPVQTQFGYHLITVYDRRTEEVPVDTMQASGEAISERLRSMEVSVSPDLGSWDSSSFSVVEPDQATSSSTEAPAAPEATQPTEGAEATEGAGSTEDTAPTDEGSSPGTGSTAPADQDGDPAE